MTSINSLQITNTNSISNNEPKKNDSKNNATNNTNKVLIGVTGALALAGCILGGIKYNGHLKFTKELNKAKNSLDEIIKLVKNDSRIKENFDLSKIDEEIKLAVKQARETKDIKILEKLNNEYFDVKYSVSRKNAKDNLETFFNETNTEGAKELKKLIEEKGDFVKFKNLYLKEYGTYVRNNNSFDSIAIGKNLDETIDLFIKEGLLPAGVKPHTYDLSKELDNIAVCRYHGGFNDYNIEKGSKRIERMTVYTPQSVVKPYNIAPQENPSKQINQRVCSWHSQNSGNNVVTLSFPQLDGSHGHSTHPMSIGIGNKNGELTPLQKDLIEVGGRLKDEEIKAFTKLLGYDITKDTFNMDYDAILSLIQHYRKDSSFMARPII